MMLAARRTSGVRALQTGAVRRGAQLADRRAMSREAAWLLTICSAVEDGVK